MSQTPACPDVPALLPCPFCGTKAHIASRKISAYGKSIEYVVECSEWALHCPAAHMCAYTPKKEWAIAAWNKRADRASRALPSTALAARPEEGWKPIETAPKGAKGTAFMMLAYGPEGDQTTGHGMHFHGRFYAASAFYLAGVSYGERQFAFREHEVQPTHWMPSPPVPSTPSTAGDGHD